MAAFAKRLARLALHAPSDSAECVLRLIYNLLKRHPECQCLVNRTAASASPSAPTPTACGLFTVHYKSALCCLNAELDQYSYCTVLDLYTRTLMYSRLVRDRCRSVQRE